jgi:hypothetical protein
MVQAFTDGVNIISMSLGETNGWSETGEDVVASRISAQGVFMSIAAGNDGAEGLFDASSPASGIGVTSVGSVDNIANLAYSSLTSMNQTIVPRPPFIMFWKLTVRRNISVSIHFLR